ncbi:MAG: glycosyltransferase [Actinomycetota bacterium]|nr:glycosyltransferase [Actinomycetota bacterium]
MALSSEELVVVSHLRWVYVWQRPQQLISRIGRGRRTWFVEEPWATVVGPPTLRTEEQPPVTRVWLDVHGEPQWHVPFDDPRAEGYVEDLLELLGLSPGRTVWLYTPMALHIAHALEPALLVYDVMDDLAAFAKAPPELAERHRQVLEEADVVFTGGRSLHRAVSAVRPDAHLFPSGVDARHYAAARRRKRDSGRPVAGYVGVIDERLDLELIATLAAALPAWEIRMVGPVIEKIDRESVPRAPNIVYLGKQPYERLPELMAEFDVALMPFALNEATRSINPTKTLEYLAAGLPVVSTRVPDVVADYADFVTLADDGEAFAAACQQAIAEDAGERAERVQPLLDRLDWDAIAARMEAILRETAATRA